MGKVLVADDSETMRKIVVRSLMAVGVSEDNIVEAADGNEAIARFAPGQFAVVLTDWNMPGKSGIEVTQAIRIQDADVPIMMITTESEKRAVLEAIAAGVTDYLSKPFRAEVLRQKLIKHGCDGSLV